MKPLAHTPPHFEPMDEAFAIDDEASAFAAELITEATSAQYIAEEARNEAFAEETRDLYDVDFTALDE